MLEGWLSDDGETRLDAYHQVISALWHQGSIYPATPYAVPFLVELLCSTEAPCRGRAATALALIASAAAHAADPNETHGRLVLKQLARSVQQLVETALAEPALRQIVVVVLAQMQTERSFVGQRLEAGGLTAELQLLAAAGASSAAAFKLIQQYGDESDPNDEAPAVSDSERAKSAQLVAADVDALNWEADWEE